MRSNNYKSVLKHAGLAATVLLLASGVAFGQQTVNLSVGPATATLPDGTAVPMWGYTCGTAVTGSTATCTALNPAVQTLNTNPATPVASVGSLWSPVVITVPTGQDLTIRPIVRRIVGCGPAGPATWQAGETIPTQPHAGG